VDEAGNSRAGIRLPAIAAPVGTYGGWNFRSPAIGRPDQLFGEMGSFHPMPRTKEERLKSGDSRLSIAERYKSRDEYIARATTVAKQMVKDRFLLPEDLNDPIDQAVTIYDWAVNPSPQYKGVENERKRSPVAKVPAIGAPKADAVKVG
jgi:hypothetical protein